MGWREGWAEKVVEGCVMGLTGDGEIQGQPAQVLTAECLMGHVRQRHNVLERYVSVVTWK